MSGDGTGRGGAGRGSLDLGGLSPGVVLDLPERLTEVTSWHSHLPFAFWCVEALRPRVLVELGTHKGDSYTGFCQAVKRLGLATACYAVDTWRGDHEAGFYGDEVLEELRAWHDPRYAAFSRLVRSTFDEALAHFADGTIDLLHIDGLHTYEAVRHDFESWRPKLSERGVVLFHDINVREQDFGAWRFWEEVRLRYPHFTFLHGHGLGVLLVGEQPPEAARRLVGCTGAEAEGPRALFAGLGNRVDLVAAAGREVVRREDLERRLAEAEVTRSKAEADIGRSGTQLADTRSELADTRSKLAESTGQLGGLRLHLQDARRAADKFEAQAKSLALLTNIVRNLGGRQGSGLDPWLRQLEGRPGPSALRKFFGSLRRRLMARRIAASGLFDAAYYRTSYPFLAPGLDLLRHYVKRGADDGLNPAAMFDTAWYRREYPEVELRGLNPLYHFITEGVDQGYRPHPHYTARQLLKRAAQAAPAEGGPPEAATPASKTAGAASAPPRPPTRLNVRPIGSAWPGSAPPASGQRPRTILLSHVLPHPPRAGNEYRMDRLIGWLERSGHEVLVVIAPLPGEDVTPARVEAAAGRYRNLVICTPGGDVHFQLEDGMLCKSLEAANGIPLRGAPPPSAGITEILATESAGIERTFCPDHLLELLRVVVAGRPPAVFVASYVFMSRALLRLGEDTLKVIDTHDVFSTKQQKVLRFGLQDALALSGDAEASMLARADLVVAIQPEEAKELSVLAGHASVVTAGVDFDVARDAHPSVAPIILYVASFNPMNVRGLADFLALAWPLIRRERPDAVLRVVGPVGESVFPGTDGVELLGRVSELGPAYAAARLVINPAVAGTGLKIKTLEALANLRPVVVWPSGVDGLSAASAARCQVVTDWYQFARAVLDQLAEGGAEKLFAARDEIEQELGPDRVYAELGAALARHCHAGGEGAGT